MYQIIALKMTPEKYNEIKKFIKKKGFNISFWAAEAIV